MRVTSPLAGHVIYSLRNVPGTSNLIKLAGKLL